MTDRQLGKILEALHAGKTLTDGLKAARMSRERYDREIAADPEIEELVQAAMEPKAQPEAAAVAAPASEPIPAIVIEATPPAPEEPEEPEPYRLDKKQITAEAAELAGGMFGFVLWVDRKCVDYGMPPLSDWWRFSLSGFYGSGKRWGIFEVGRGGGKSTSLTRIAATEGLFAERQVPPGQRWIWAFISVGLDDATRRIVEIEQVLRAVGIDPEVKRPSGRPTVELEDVNGQNIAFVSLASTISGVSGPNSIGITLDEEAKLRDRAKNANPSSEIIASAAQTFRARPNIHGFRCSSAYMVHGSHYDSVIEGDTSSNFVARIGEQFLAPTLKGLYEVADYELMLGTKAGADKIREYARTLTAHSANVPTWIANPTIGALASRMEVDALPPARLGGMSRAEYWLRENASVAMGGSSQYSAGDMRELVAMNRRLNSPDRERPGLIQFDKLPDWDPRSRRGQRARRRVSVI